MIIQAIGENVATLVLIVRISRMSQDWIKHIKKKPA